MLEETSRLVSLGDVAMDGIIMTRYNEIAYAKPYHISSRWEQVTDFSPPSAWIKTKFGHSSFNYDYLLEDVFGQGEILYVGARLTSAGIISLHGASDTEITHAQVEEAFKPYITTEVPQQDHVKMNFFVFRPSSGMDVNRRSIKITEWDSIKSNYTPEAAFEFERLTELMHDDGSGKIVVWHGPPGTGKTYAIRALMDLMRDVNFHYIVDPENFLSNTPDYMIDVLMNISPHADDPNDTRGDAMNMIILEDTGDALRPSDHHGQTSALSRLLNITDGLIGQGLNLKLMITTNDEMEDFHPAIRRHGRCLSIAKFGHLTAAHATQWLSERGIDHLVHHPITLSELYAILGDYQQPDKATHEETLHERPAMGLYM